MNEIRVTEINITKDNIEIIRMPERKDNEFLITGVNQKYELSKDVKINILDRLPIRNIEEELRVCELENKELHKKIVRCIKEKSKLINALRVVKEQYENDFTEEELLNLFKERPRDKLIYNSVTRILLEVKNQSNV